MEFLRKAVLVLLGLVYGPLLLLLASVISLTAVAGQPTYIKDTLRQGQTYTALRNTLVKNATQDNKTATPEITRAINQTFTPGAMQDLAEQLIDQIYTWLDTGTSAQPSLNLNLRPLKQTFLVNIRSELQHRTARLPQCTTAKPQKTSDVLSLNCLPAGTKASTIVNQAMQQIETDKTILPKDTVSLDSLKQDKDGKESQPKTPKKDLSNIARGYRLVRRSTPYIFGLILACGGAIIFMSSTKRKGIRRVATLLLPYGLTIAALAWIGLVILQKLAIAPSTGGNAQLTAALESTGKLVSTKLLLLNRNLGLLYAGLGTAGLLGLFFYKRAHYEPPANTDKEES